MEVIIENGFVRPGVKPVAGLYGIMPTVMPGVGRGVGGRRVAIFTPGTLLGVFVGGLLGRGVGGIGLGRSAMGGPPVGGGRRTLTSILGGTLTSMGGPRQPISAWRAAAGR